MLNVIINLELAADLVKGNAESIPLPITTLGLELDDNLYDNRLVGKW